MALGIPDSASTLPRIAVIGVGGGGGNAVNNMIAGGLRNVEFVVANTDAQALLSSKCDRRVQLGLHVTQGLGAGAQPEVGLCAAEEAYDEVVDILRGTNLCFVTAGMGGGTGTGAAPVLASAARSVGALTVGVVTVPFDFEGKRRREIAEHGLESLESEVDAMIVIRNQNLFRVADQKTTLAGAFELADRILHSGVACITDLMVKEGLVNLDFADVRSVMLEMGRAMMGMGEASGEGRGLEAARQAVTNPLLDQDSIRGATGLLVSISGGRDMTLFEVDEAAMLIREEAGPEANVIVGAACDPSLEGRFRVSVVAAGIGRAHSSCEARKEPSTEPVGRPAPERGCLADAADAAADEVARYLKAAGGR